MWLVNTAPTFAIDFGDVSVGDVTLTITRANGTAVVTDAATTNNNDGTYSYQLAKTDNTQLDRLRLDWEIVPTTEVVTLYEEIVGNLLFTIEEARGARFTGQQSPLSDVNVFPDSTIARARSQIASQFEQKTGRSWIRRYARMELSGSGTFALTLRGVSRDVDGNTVGGQGRTRDIASIISVTANGETVDPAILVLKGNRLLRTSGHWPAATQSNPLNVVVEYEYGDDPVDLEARENGLRMIVANLIPSDVPNYAQTITSGGESNSFQQSPNFVLRVYPERVREWIDRNPSMAVA